MSQYPPISSAPESDDDASSVSSASTASTEPNSSAGYMDTNRLGNTLVGTTRTILNETYNTAILGINTGMALAVALAWNETAKKIIKHHVQVKNLTQYHIVYASAVTLLAGFVFAITQMFFKPSIKRTEVKPVIAVGA